MVSIVAFQAVDPSSILGVRSNFFVNLVILPNNPSIQYVAFVHC